MKQTAATIGFFDGVHQGHRFLLSELQRLGAQEAVSTLVLTFDTHPLAVVRPGTQPALLSTPEERLTALRKEADAVVVLPFTIEMAQQTAEQFLQILHDNHGVRHLLMGHDHRFGCDGRGLTPADYTTLGHRVGIHVHHAPKAPSPASSSLIRSYLLGGNATVAAELLGRPYSLTGTVVHGRKVGRTIGFPTANLCVPPTRLVPDLGIYACRATIAGTTHNAVTSIGQRPTLNNGTDVTIETYVLDFEGDLYDQEMTLHFVRRLRSEMKFESLDILQQQIARDCDKARQVLA